MKKKIFVVSISLLFLFFMPPSSAENEANFTVYGQVFDTNGITPVNGVTVTITVSGSSLSTTTVDGKMLNGTPVNGTYYFPNLPVGAGAGTLMTLTASTAGKSASATVARAVAEPQEVNLYLTTGSTTGSGSGSSSGSSSGGGGGGGGASAEPFENILKKETREEFISKDLPATYNLVTPDVPVYAIVVTGNTNAGLVNVQVEHLKSTSKLAKKQPPGTVYMSMNIWLGTAGYATPKNIKEATIKFKVENPWLVSNDFKDTDIALARWDGTDWAILDTRPKNKDDKYTYFEARTNAFSPFAVTSLKGIKTATPAPTPGEEKTTEPTGAAVPAAVPTKKTSGFEAFIALVTLSAASMFGRKRR